MRHRPEFKKAVFGSKSGWQSVGGERISYDSNEQSLTGALCCKNRFGIEGRILS